MPRHRRRQSRYPTQPVPPQSPSTRSPLMPALLPNLSTDVQNSVNAPLFPACEKHHGVHILNGSSSSKSFACLSFTIPHIVSFVPPQTTCRVFWNEELVRDCYLHPITKSHTHALPSQNARLTTLQNSSPLLHHNSISRRRKRDRWFGTKMDELITIVCI